MKRWFIWVAEDSNNNILNDFISIGEKVAAASTREKKLPSSVSAASTQIGSVTADLRQARDMISPQSGEQANDAQFMMSVTSMEDNVPFYDRAKGV